MVEEGTPPAAAKLMEMAWGYWTSQILRQAAEMGLADYFGEGERQADELAAELDLHAPSLRRYLRSLTGLGLLSHTTMR